MTDTTKPSSSEPSSAESSGYDQNMMIGFGYRFRGQDRFHKMPIRKQRELHDKARKLLARSLADNLGWKKVLEQEDLVPFRAVVKKERKKAQKDASDEAEKREARYHWNAVRTVLNNRVATLRIPRVRIVDREGQNGNGGQEWNAEVEVSAASSDGEDTSIEIVPPTSGGAPIPDITVGPLESSEYVYINGKQWCKFEFSTLLGDCTADEANWMLSVPISCDGGETVTYILEVFLNLYFEDGTASVEAVNLNEWEPSP